MMSVFQIHRGERMAWLVIHVSDDKCLRLLQKEQEANDRKRAHHLNMSYKDFLKRKLELRRQKEAIVEAKKSEKKISFIQSCAS